MEKQFIGCIVSVDCGEHGIYQGEVTCINSDRLILKKAFKNGVPHSEHLATIRLVNDLVFVNFKEYHRNSLIIKNSFLLMELPRLTGKFYTSFCVNKSERS